MCVFWSWQRVVLDLNGHDQVVTSGASDNSAWATLCGRIIEKCEVLYGETLFRRIGPLFHQDRTSCFTGLVLFENPTLLF